jgi:hypothetical protein
MHARDESGELDVAVLDDRPLLVDELAGIISSRKPQRQ